MKNLCVCLPGLIMAVVSGVLFSACAGSPVKTFAPPKVALVLGGGGARGFAHVGVIRELESAKVPIDMIVGVSVGSLIGALYADCADSFQLEWKSFKIKKEEIFDFKLLNITDGLAKGEAIQTYMDANITTRYLEDLKIPLAVVAADLSTGTPVVFKRGLIKDAVRASVSVPGVFAPVPYQGQWLVDGGVLGNLAPEVAKAMGANVIIGVDVSRTRNSVSTTTPNALTVILESINIMGGEIVRLKHDQFSVLISPDVGTVGITDFTRKQELIEAGRKAAREALPRIQALLGKYSSPETKAR